jgi:hypothetical protein
MATRALRPGQRLPGGGRLIGAQDLRRTSLRGISPQVFNQTMAGARAAGVVTGARGAPRGYTPG